MRDWIASTWQLILAVLLALVLVIGLSGCRFSGDLRDQMLEAEIGQGANPCQPACPEGGGP